VEIAIIMRDDYCGTERIHTDVEKVIVGPNAISDAEKCVDQLEYENRMKGLFSSSYNVVVPHDVEFNCTLI
jgi:hypothetical protein